MKSLLVKITNFLYIKDKILLPSDIYDSIFLSTENENWYDFHGDNRFNNIHRCLEIKYNVFFGYVASSTIPGTKYYIDRERSLTLLSAIQTNMKSQKEKEVEKNRIKLKKSCQTDLIELSDNDDKKIDAPEITITER
jgi:hypothetical protein